MAVKKYISIKEKSTNGTRNRSWAQYLKKKFFFSNILLPNFEELSVNCITDVLF